MRKPQSRWTTAALVGTGILVIAMGADDPKTQKINAGQLTFEAPATWKSSRPSSAMRKAQLAVPPVKGDADPAELVVYAFPGGAGGVEANIERWRGQFKDDQGKAPKAETKNVKGKNVEVKRVEVAGDYTDPFAGKGTQPKYRLLGAIVETPETSYFLKMVGPDQTVSAAEKGFDQMLATLAVAKE